MMGELRVPTEDLLNAADLIESVAFKDVEHATITQRP